MSSHLTEAEMVRERASRIAKALDEGAANETTRVMISTVQSFVDGWQAEAERQIRKRRRAVFGLYRAARAERE